MARQSSLATVRSMVKAHTNRSLNSTVTSPDAELNQIIFDTQAWLAGEFDWPFLKSRWDVPVSANTRYIAFPVIDDVSLTVAINFERPAWLLVKWNSVWQPVDYGISETQELNYLDSDIGQVSDPVQRWQFDDEGNFEIWPLPASSTVLRFVGQRQLTDLRTSVGPPIAWNDSALLDLDDQMVSMFASAEYLLRDEDVRGSQAMLSRATNRMGQIRATYPRRTIPACVIGGSQRYDRRFIRTVPMIVIGASNGGSGGDGGSGTAIGTG